MRVTALGARGCPRARLGTSEGPLPAPTLRGPRFWGLQGLALGCPGDAPMAAAALGTSRVRVQRENVLGKSRVPLSRTAVVAFRAPASASIMRSPTIATALPPTRPQKGTDLEGSQLSLQREPGVGHPAPPPRPPPALLWGRAPRQQRALGVPEPVSPHGRREGALWERVLECHG